MKPSSSSFALWALPSMLILFGFAMRLLPHAPNFAPIGAIALFGGMYLPKRLAIILPLGAMLLSDSIIGFYSWQIMLSVYGSFALMGFIGLWLRRHKRFLFILGGTLAGSILFYLITNVAVWAFGTMYPHTLAGLMQSYVNALPFFRNTLFGDALYVTLLVGGFEAMRYWIFSRSLVPKKLIPRSY